MSVAEEHLVPSVTHGVSHRGQDHDITPLDAPCLHTNPVSFGSSALHLKRQFASNNQRKPVIIHPCWDADAAGVFPVLPGAAEHFCQFPGCRVPPKTSRKVAEKHQETSVLPLCRRSDSQQVKFRLRAEFLSLKICRRAAGFKPQSCSFV